MPGTMLLGRDGVCGYHGMEASHDWPKITRALLAWDCVVQAIRDLRRVILSPDSCTDVQAQNAVMRTVAGKLLEAAHGWHDRTQPRRGDTPGDYARKLQLFLEARVKEELTSATGGSLDERKPTHTVADMRAGLRDVPLGNPNIVEASL